MDRKTIFMKFLLCFCVWGVAVDNVILPKLTALKQDVGQYTRYRVKKWDKSNKFEVLENELMVYAIVKNREQLYYMNYKPHFEATLKSLSPGTPLQLRYDMQFPKFWKRHLYDLRSFGISILSYSPAYMILHQREIWKFTGIMGGVFLFLVALGLIKKPVRKKS
ncbi:MAG: hypothetical protein V3V05_13215 [Pontiella sp.]